MTVQKAFSHCALCNVVDVLRSLCDCDPGDDGKCAELCTLLPSVAQILTTLQYVPLLAIIVFGWCHGCSFIYQVVIPSGCALTRLQTVERMYYWACCPNCLNCAISRAS
jgi:hypothetical protein